MEISHAYDDILHLPHHVSEDRPHMSLTDRGAQFAPFAAFTGYEAAIEETARLTEEKRELTEEQKAVIGSALQVLRERGPGAGPVTVVYFERDHRKEGGAYRRLTGTVERIDEHSGVLELSGGPGIAFEEILELEL